MKIVAEKEKMSEEIRILKKQTDETRRNIYRRTSRLKT